MRIENVTLEMSLKPFRCLEQEAVLAVCREAFRQWLPLARNAAGLSVLLWTADGSEILDYRGDPDGEIEWARYIGGANPRAAVPNDPEKKALHSRSYLYVENPPVLTYRGLARIVAALKSAGAEVTGLPIRVGATFDPGPEFAISPFKYERHNEICLAGTMGLASFACCYTALNADDVAYAGFPEGIPQGTPLGTFLGRQSQHFLSDLGFDYIWLSNGFGFGMETWATKGVLFDGQAFRPEHAHPTREKILDFWRLFRAECPEYPIETRGTNLTTGIDLASDAVPLKEIYAGGFNLAPPPNSPWAALNGDFGFELVGYMSHVAEVPGDGYPFRFYVHDPWWLNSPWLDRYGRDPHDIYLPLSVSRVDGRGEARNPTAVELLTIDNSFGEMPEQCPNEVIPHLLAAIGDAPDQPGPVVWVYPFDEYHAMAFGEEPRLEEVFFGDWFMRSAVNAGFPLNTVVSSANLLASLDANPTAFQESVLVATVPDAGSAVADALMRRVESGGDVLLYGPLMHAGADLLAALNIRLDAPLSGELDLDLRLEGDALSTGSLPRRIHHRDLFSAGGIRAVVAKDGDPYTEVGATVTGPAGTRVAALSRRLPEWDGGTLAWVRGTNSSSYRGGHLLTPDDPREWFQGGLLMRLMLSRFGYCLRTGKRDPQRRDPITCVARHEGGFFLSGYTPDTTVALRLRFPQGAPILVGLETELEGGCSTYRMPRGWHRECRVFVEGQDEGVVSCAEQHSGEIGVRRRLHLTGLENATVRFYPERGTDGQVRMLRNPAFPYLQGEFLECAVEEGRHGRCLVARDVTGPLLISW